MATPTPKHRPPFSAPTRPAAQSAPADVTPAWLLRALAITVGVAAVLAYLAVCLLVYQGAWQFILHPSHTVPQTPTAVDIPFEPVHFDSAPTGTPRLTAWWVPASIPTSRTILLLHDARGSLSATLSLIPFLHQANVNIFAFDYRGFGLSDSAAHPTQATMAQDAEAALTWLTDTRHVAASEIVPYGSGLAATLAAQLALDHPALPAVIIDNPDLTTVPAVLHDPRGRLLPMRLLVQDRFDLAASLDAVTRPRMLIAGGPGGGFTPDTREITHLYNSVPSPKLTLTLPPEPEMPCVATGGQTHCSVSPHPAYIAAFARFLDESLPAPIENLKTPQRTR